MADKSNLYSTCSLDDLTIFFINMKKTIQIISFILFLITAILASCSKNGTNDPLNTSGSRNYYLGFTPFPHNITTAAVQDVYTKLKNDADIIAHHFDDGLPWQESFDGNAYPSGIISDWQFRLANTPATHKKYVAVTPINISRNGLAPNRTSIGSEPLQSPWINYSFNHPDVKTAYLNYCRRVAEFFQPDYFVIGIEVNLLIDADTTLTLWNRYLELHKFVFVEMKNLYPEIPIFVSLTGMDLIEGFTEAIHADQLKGLNAIKDFSDVLGISIYPYLSIFLTNPLPDNLFAQIFSLTDKPLAICETGYPAEQFSIEGGTFQFNGTPQKQKSYFENLLQAASDYEVEFIINFVLQDYDSLWTAIGSPDDFQKLWRDTGFYDEDGTEREVFNIWRENLGRVKK
jgi:hypothetical protein